MVSEVKAWMQWEEVVVSNDRGRREVHYYIKDGDGRRNLAVVGREKSARHMGYAVPEKFRQSLLRMGKYMASPSAAAAVAASAVPSDLKLRSRREVVDWISLLVSAFKQKSCSSAGIPGSALTSSRCGSCRRI